MRRFLQGSLYSSLGLVVLLGYQNCTKSNVKDKVPVVAKGSLSSEWKDIYSKK
jgi:hypothetical protein